MRLIEPAADSAPPPTTCRPTPSAMADGRLLAIARLHIFGSEELSRRAPGVAALAPAPYVLLHPDDATRRG